MGLERKRAHRDPTLAALPQQHAVVYTALRPKARQLDARMEKVANS